MALGDWTAAAGQAIGPAINTAQNLGRLQLEGERERALQDYRGQALALQDKNYQLSSNEDIRKQKAFDYTEQDRQKQLTINKTLRPVLSEFPNLDKNPTFMKAMIASAKAAGFEVQDNGPVLLASGEAIDFVKKGLESDIETKTLALKSLKVDAEANFMKVSQEKMDLEQNGKPVKPELMQRFNAASQQYASIVNGQKELEREIARQNIGKTIESLKSEGIWATMPSSVQTTLISMQNMGDETGFKEVMAKWATAQLGEGKGQPIGSGGLRLPNGEIVPPAARPGGGTAAWKVVEDKKSPTGYSYQNLNDPASPLRPGAPKPGAGDSAMQLNPDTLKALADRFGMTGEVPGMGMGKSATEARTKVLNQWAQELKNTGQTAQDQVAKQAAYKASKAELTKLQGQRGSVMAFAATADKNLELAGTLSDKVGRSGVPVINRWIVGGKRSLTGDVDVAKFDAAIRTAINEYARVTSSVTGGGVTSDTARKEVEAMLNTALTPAQVKGVIQTLKTEMANRRSGYDEQIQSIKDSLAGKTSGKEVDNDPLGIRK